MKKLILPLCFVFAWCSYSCNSTDNSVAKEIDIKDSSVADKSTNPLLLTSIASMRNKFSALKLTGNTDVDYASIMVIHHQGTIDISNAQMTAGSDEALKQIAQTLIKDETAELNILKSIAPKLKVDSIQKSDGHDHLQTDLNEMISRLNSLNNTGSIDKDFAMLIVPHQQTAIAMAENEIRFGKNNELKKLAARIVEDQRVEVATLKKWLLGK